MIRKPLRKLITPRLFGTRRYQAFWEKLHSWSLEGMHIGHWESILDPGEVWVLGYFKTYLQNRSRTGSLNGDRPIVVDVGANVGIYTLEVLRQLGNGVRIYCFEPSRSTFIRLAEAMKGHENVECINTGLSGVAGCKELFSVGSDTCLSSVYNRFRFNDGGIDATGQNCEPIVTQTLDDFCQEREIKRVDLLKVDVEGHELEVLKGAQKLIANRAIGMIQFEFGGVDVDSRTFLHDFFELLEPDYQIHRVLKDGITRLHPYHEKREIFLYSNYLAVLCHD